LIETNVLVESDEGTAPQPNELIAVKTLGGIHKYAVKVQRLSHPLTWTFCTRQKVQSWLWWRVTPSITRDLLRSVSSCMPHALGTGLLRFPVGHRRGSP